MLIGNTLGPELPHTHSSMYSCTLRLLGPECMYVMYMYRYTDGVHVPSTLVSVDRPAVLFGE